MPKFAYIGDPALSGDGPAYVDFRGLRFPFGAFVDIADHAIAEKLENNSHFIGETDQKPDYLSQGRRAVELEPEPELEDDGSHWTGWDKPTLIQRAEESFGLKLDGRKRLEDLQAQVEAHLKALDAADANDQNSG